MTTPVVRVGVSCLCYDSFTGKFLVGERRGSHGSGTICCPGGHLEIGEDFSVCAARELKEETAINILPIHFHFLCVTNDFFGGERHYITIHHLVEWNGQIPINTEPHKCNGWIWLSLLELGELATAGKLFIPMQNLLGSGFLTKIPKTIPPIDCSYKVIFLMGFPGSGKGTQGPRLAARLGMKHVSTGELFRAEAKSGSEIGKIMNSFMQEGKIIPSEYTFQYLRNEFSKPEYTCGILLDGYPKDEECYHFVTSLCQELGFTPLSAVFFDISREIVQARLEARIYCPNCETNYHKTFKALQPLVENVCDKCSHIGLSPRLDDNLKTITKRLDVFDNSTRGNVELFRRSGILHTISAGGHPDDITSDILRVVNEALKAHRVKSQSYYLYPLREPERSTKWHNHIDGPNIDVIESIVRRIHDVQPNAQNKIYPIKDLFLCQQIFNNKFVSVYGQMPNFHYIRNSTTEAFTTGKMGEEGLDYDLVNLTLSIVSSIPHAMTEIEEDLYEASYSSSTGCEVIHRDDGDSTTTIDWSKLTASKYGCDGQLRTETETEALAVDWYQCLLPSIPKYELHHAVDIPLSSCHDLPFTVEKLNLCIASNSNHLNNSLFDIGGLFMFKKKDVWAYRTSEFSNMSYEESLQRLKAQALVLHDVIGSLVENKDFYCALSLEKVHAIWKFD